MHIADGERDISCAVGVAIGGLGGWKGTIQIPEGGDIAFRDIIRPYTPLGLAPAGVDAVLHVNSFEVKYRADGSEEQFVSDLSVWDSDGRELKRKDIQVNTPLRYKVCPPSALSCCLLHVPAWWQGQHAMLQHANNC